MARYRFTTRMRFGTGREAVHRAIVAPEGWVARWADAVELARVEDGTSAGVGRRFDATVRAPLGYRLTACITITDVGPDQLTMRSTGDLVGDASWWLRSHDGAETGVRFDWDVVATPAWMRVLSPLARPLFERSHGVVVRHAAEAVAAHLGAPLTSFASQAVHGRPLPP